MSHSPIPFFRPDLSGSERQRLLAVLESGWLTTGEQTAQFEAAFAKAVGAEHAVALNSATAALHLALEAVGIGPGDEVLVPTMTFAATAEVVIHLGAKPVLVDCLPDTLCIDPDKAALAVTLATRAILPVHYAGLPCRMDAIEALAARHGLSVIEDAAHAFPASCGQRPIGSIGTATCFSFYATKTITTGEGGMLTTADPALAQRARQMSLHGLSRDAWQRYGLQGTWTYDIEHPGFKYNLPDLAAALGLAQLERAETMRAARQERAGWYDAALADIEAIERPPHGTGVQHAWHLYAVKLRLDRAAIDRDECIRRLAERQIGTSVHWIPLHMHTYYRNRFGFSLEDFPVASEQFPRLISLPFFPAMTHDQVEQVAAALREMLA